MAHWVISFERSALRSAVARRLALAGALLIAIAANLGMPLTLLAQEPAARVVAESAPVTVGDVVALVIEVDHPADTVVILPELPSVWGDFEVRAQHPAAVETHEDGRLTTREQVDVELFAPGSFQTPPLTAVISDRLGSKSEVAVAPASVVVNTLLTLADSEPRDIKPQAEVGGGWLRSAGMAAAALALIVSLGVLFWWLRRRHALRKTSLQRALDELDAIEAVGYPKQGRYQELYYEVSHCLRHHLKREFGVSLDERTTSEMRTRLRQLPLAQETTRRLITFFQESDLVKFAHVTPTDESAATLMMEARGLCREVSTARQEQTAPAATTTVPARG